MVLAIVLCAAVIQQPAKREPLVYDIEIAPNDKWMAVSTSSDKLYIYSLDGKLLRTVQHKKNSHLVDIEISHDGKLLVCSNIDYAGGYCPVWDTATWKEVSKIGVWATKTFCNPPSGVEFAGKGKYVVGQTIYGQEVYCWNARTGDIEYEARRTRRFTGFAIHNESTFAMLSEAGAMKLRFWEFENSGNTKRWGSEIKGVDPRSLRNPRFSRDGKRLFLITQSQKAFCVFNVLAPEGGKTDFLVQARMQGLQPRDSVWSGDDKYIWVCGLEGHIFCFEPSSGALKKRWVGHDGLAIRAISATTKGYKVVSGSEKTLCIWDGDDGKLLKSFTLP